MTGLIGGFDSETTGFDFDKGDRIVEVALLTYDATTKKLVNRYVRRINPMRPIPSAATAVHGITFEQVAHSPQFGDIADELVERLSWLDRLVIHNAAFDVPFLVGEIALSGKALPKVDAFCTMVNGTWATYDGKKPSLQELCRALGIEFDATRAHAAEYDVEKMMEAYFEGVRRNVYPAVSVASSVV